MKHRVAPGTSPCIFDEQALYLSTDGGPLDVQLPRTRALIADLKKMPGAPDLRAVEAGVADVASQAKTAKDPKRLFVELRGPRGRRRCPIRC